MILKGDSGSAFGPAARTSPSPLSGEGWGYAARFRESTPLRTGGNGRRPYPAPADEGKPVGPRAMPLAAASAPDGNPAARSAARAMEFLRRRERSAEGAPGGETARVEIARKSAEEKLERRILERAEAMVLRETAPDSPPMRKLGERIYSGLYEGLVLEKERLGSG